MDQETLESLLAEWQKTLRLRDWDVVVQLSRIFDMPVADSVGLCTWLMPAKTATIRILDPADYDPAYVHPFDPEKTLVHELLHLHFAPFFPDGEAGENVAHEQAIESIAKALVTVKRGVIPVVDKLAKH